MARKKTRKQKASDNESTRRSSRLREIQSKTGSSSASIPKFGGPGEIQIDTGPLPESFKEPKSSGDDQSKKPLVPGENQIDTGPPKEGNGGREKRKASDKPGESQDTDTRKRAKNTEEKIDLSEEGKNLVAHRIACLINFTNMRAKDDCNEKELLELQPLSPRKPKEYLTSTCYFSNPEHVSWCIDKLCTNPRDGMCIKLGIKHFSEYIANQNRYM
jgi:hypothetical protein